MLDATPCLKCGHVNEYKGRGMRAKHCMGDACRRELARQRAAAWYAERKDDPAWRDRIAANRARAGRRWRDRNREHVAAKLAEWRAGNREAMTEQYRKWRIENADRVRAKNHRRRALLADAFVQQVDFDAIWERDGGVCQLCNESIDPKLPWPNPMSKTLDHVIPLSRGGTHEPRNVQLAHALCNCIKGDRA